MPEFPIVDFIPVHNEVESLHYPKAGDRNSVVGIGVVSVEDGTTVWMDIGGNTDIYVPRIKWLPDSRTLAIYRLNRAQNKLELMLAGIQTGHTQTILTEEDEKGWIDVHDDLTFVKGGERFIWPSNRNGFKHLYLYDIQGNLIRPLTSGNWEVDDLIAIDEKNELVYFLATERAPWECHLYHVDLSGKGFERLSRDDGWHRIDMAADCRYYLDFFSTYIRPPVVTLHTVDGEKVDVIEPNEIGALKEYDLSPPEFFSFKTDDGVELNAFMVKPQNFDPDWEYPVLIYTYGGPGSQIVRNVWEDDARKRNLWHQMMAQRGYIIFGIDNRGTGAGGKEWMQTVYLQLGKFEVLDNIAGVKYLQELAYVDSSRICIWGWSYGGYTTLMCMLRGGDYFKMGIAVAPPVDWRNYDTVYTERYMGMPEDNLEGYEASSALTYAENLQGKLLLIHGTSDDNVHVANTMQLVYAFQNARIPFDIMIYPRKMHHLDGQDTRVHLYNLITNYIEKNL